MITKFKIFENVQYSMKILKDIEVPSDDTRYLELKKLLHNNLGYLGKFTEWLFKDEFSFNLLSSLYNELKIIKLDKPIDQFKTPEEVYDY